MPRPAVQQARSIPARAQPNTWAAGLHYVSTEWTEHEGHFPCQVSADRRFTEGGSVAPERFTALQIALLLGPAPRAGSQAASALAAKVAHRFAAELRSSAVVHFFHDASRLPADADCTALAYLLVLSAGLDLEAQAHRAFDTIAANTGCDGVVATYFERSGERAGIIDAVVAANVVRLAVRLGRTDEVRATTAFLDGLVRDRSYLDGSRYYPSPDCLLYSLALGRPVPGLREAIAARMGASAGAIDLAQRILAARRVGLVNAADRDRLIALADADGTWPAEGWFCYGRSRRWFGSRALSTAFALAALAVP